MKYVVLSFMLLLSLSSFSQRGRGNGNHGNGGRGNGHNVAGRPQNGRPAVRHSAYRPATIIVYHPRWRPAYAYHRRWVYFPGRNMYWDNWRNHYVFWNGTVWISQPAPPKGLQEKDLANEKSKELKEEEDDVDDVYKSNDQHKKDD